MQKLDEITASLNAFKCGKNKIDFAKQLAALVQQHETLPECLASIGRDAENKKYVNETSLPHIIRYLQLKQQSDALSTIFRASVLKELDFIAKNKNSTLAKTNNEHFTSICDAISWGLDSKLLTLSDFEVITHLDSRFLRSPVSVAYIKVVLNSKDLKTPVITILNYLAECSASASGEDLVLGLENEKPLQLYTAVTALKTLGIEIGCLVGWSEVAASINPKWKTIKAQLNAVAFTLMGFKHVLKYINPAKVTASNINALNQLLEIFIPSDATEKEWLDLEKHFSQSNHDQATIFSRIEEILQAAAREKQSSSDPRELVNRLLTKRDLAEKPVVLHAKLTTSEGSALHARIRHFNDPGADVPSQLTNDHLSELNKLVAKPQLPFLNVLDNLSPEWFSLLGLTTLNKFSERVLEPASLAFLARLNPQELNQDQIKKIESADMAELTDYFPGNAPITISAVIDHLDSDNKRQEILGSLRRKQGLAVATSVNESESELQIRQRENTNYLLTKECVLTFQPLISNKSERDVDAPIFSIHNRKTLVTVEELNSKLCIIKAGDKDRIVSRKFAQEINVESNARIGKNGVHPFNNNQEFNPKSDILDLFEKTTGIDLINIEVINRTLGLDGPDDLYETIQFFENLSNYRYLHYLPEVFFANNAELLRMLDARFIQSHAMQRYLSAFTAKQDITREILQELNQSAEALFNMLDNSANIPNHLAKLPDKYFSIAAGFTPSVFSRLPVQWLESPALIETLIMLKKSITASNFKEGDIMAVAQQTARTDIVFAIKNFKTFKKVEDFYKVYPGSTLLDILSAHYQNQELFPELVLAAAPFLTEDLARICSEDEKYTTLTVQLYQLAAANQIRNYKPFSTAIMAIFQQRTKQHLTPKDVQLERLNDMKQNISAAVSVLSVNLATYKDERLQEVNGELTTRWGTKKERLIAYKALLEALENGEEAFATCLHTIMDQSDKSKGDNIGYHDPQHSRKGLQTYCRSFNDAAEIILKEQHFVIFKECLEDEGKLRLALLDDVFFSLLLLPQLITIAETKPNIFFPLMEVYRPHQLLNMKLTSQKMALLYNNYSHGSNEEAATSHVTHATGNGHVEPRSGRIDPTLRKRITPHANTTTAQTNGQGANNLLPKPKPAILKRITHRGENPLYQLQDMDIIAALYPFVLELRAQQSIFTSDDVQQPVSPELSITEQKNEEQVDQGNINCQQPEFVILPLGLLTENKKTNETSTWNDIKETTIANKGKICLGVMNITSTHYVTLFAYTPLNGKTQILIIDPAYCTKAKYDGIQALKTVISTKFPDWTILQPPFNITQQFNDSDCGICCLENIENAIKNGLVSIKDNNLVFHPDKLTLYAERFIGEEETFVGIAASIRQKWESKLAEVKQQILFSPGQEDLVGGPYQFTANKATQYLKTTAQIILSELVRDYNNTRMRDMLDIVDKMNAIPTAEGEVKEFIRIFMASQKSKSDAYKECSNTLRTIALEHPSEKIDHLYATAIEDALLREFQFAYREKMCEHFIKNFTSNLVTQGVLDLNKINSVPENLSDFYESYITQSGDREWISFFTTSELWKHSKWEHFPSVKAEVKKFIDNNNEQIQKNQFLGLSLKKSVARAKPSAAPAPIFDGFASGLRSGVRQPVKPPPGGSTTVFGTIQQPQTVANTNQPNSNGTTTSTSDKQPVTTPLSSALREVAVQALNDLVTNLKKYPKQSEGIFYFGIRHTAQAQAAEWIRKCEKVIPWFEQPQDDKQTLEQIWLIADQLKDIMVSNRKWDTLSLEYLVMLPLAKLLGVSEKDIKNYNTPEELELNIVRPAGTNNPPVKTKMSGYAYLINSIGKKLEEFRHKNHIRPPVTDHALRSIVAQASVIATDQRRP